MNTLLGIAFTNKKEKERWYMKTTYFGDCTNLVELVDKTLDEGTKGGDSLYTSFNFDTVFREFPILYWNISHMIPDEEEYCELQEETSGYLAHANSIYEGIIELYSEGISKYSVMQEAVDEILQTLGMLALRFKAYEIDFFDFYVEDYLDYSNEY